MTKIALPAAERIGTSPTSMATRYVVDGQTAPVVFRTLAARPVFHLHVDGRVRTTSGDDFIAPSLVVEVTRRSALNFIAEACLSVHHDCGVFVTIYDMNPNMAFIG